MAKIYKSMTELIGKTPLLELTNYEKEHDLKARLLVKLEFFNPNQSVKDRIALSIIDEAEESGELQPGDTIVELTSGNTGIGLAAIAASRGYKFRTYIQDQVSVERYQVIKAFGGETIKISEEPVITSVLAERGADFVAVSKAIRKEIVEKEEHSFYADQTMNMANPRAHERTTGPEIWEDTDGEVDVFIAAVGTGGTVSGAGKYLKEKNPDIHIVAIQPNPNSIADDNNPVEEIAGVHPFEGVPKEIVPDTMNLEIYDEKFEVSTVEAYKAAQDVARSDGILIGASSGGALHVATQVAKRPEYAGKTIVFVAADTGLRYLTTNLFNEDFEQ